MEFSIKRDVLLKSLGFIQGIVEKKNTLPILSNVLIQIKANQLILLATDLEIFFCDQITDVDIKSEGSTTTAASILHDILRKIAPGEEILFKLQDGNKLSMKTASSNFSLNCIPHENFPSFPEDEDNDITEIDHKEFLKLLNKTKISISSDDTRHYLNGIFLHLTESANKKYLSGVATDSHRLSFSSIELKDNKVFPSVILPKKTVFQLCSMLPESKGKFNLSISETKIQFNIDKTKLISKVIDGKFPDYSKVIPKENKKNLMVDRKEFIDSIERVISVSLDRKEGVKFNIEKEKLKLFVNSASSGEGTENIKASFNDNSLNISFNSKYLVDIASEIEDKNISMSFKDSASPALIEDSSDKNSYYVIMPMKI